MIRSLMLLNLVVGIASGCQPAASHEAAKELEGLRGEWQAVRLEFDGKVIDDKSVSLMKWTFSAGSVKKTLLRTESDGQGLRILGVSRTVKYQLKVLAKADPKGIDLITEVNGQEVMLKGIYKLEENNLIICMADGGGERPRHFASESESVGIIVLTKNKR